MKLDAYGSMGADSFRAYLSEQAISIISKLIEKDEEKVIENIPNCDAETRKGLLEMLVKHYDESKSTIVLIDYLADSSKAVREKVIELLTLSEKSHEMLITSLSAKKQAVRESAVKALYVVSILKKNIEEWPKNSRGAIASEAVRTLILNGSNEAFMIVDSISRKFKFRQVKDAATRALKAASELIGIDMEELSDRIVPDLGFDARGEQIFDYGDRKFIVTLTPELTLEV